MKPFDKVVIAALIVLLWARFVANAAPSFDGPARAVIVYESGDTSPQLGMLINTLRTGDAAVKLKAKGIPLDVWDDEAKDENGQARVKPEWIAGVSLPALVIVDGKTWQVQRREPLPATAAEVLTRLGVE